MRFLKLYRNKICAVSFASLGVITFVLQSIFYGLEFGWNVYVQSPFRMISVLITLVVFVMLLVTNIQNDNRAISAIFMFVFMVAWGAFLSLIPTSSDLNLYGAFSGNGLLVTLAVFELLFTAATVGAGVTFYVFLVRYTMGRTPFGRCFLWSLLFLGALIISGVLETALFFTLFTPDKFLALYLALNIFPDLFMGAAVVFTLLRLKRV